MKPKQNKKYIYTQRNIYFFQMRSLDDNYRMFVWSFLAQAFEPGHNKKCTRSDCAWVQSYQSCTSQRAIFSSESSS